MKAATFKAKCKKITCRFDFDAPLLSDFSYGEFLYGSIDGNVIKYYCGLDCTTWKFVSSIVNNVVVDKDKQGSIIQKTIGLIADRDDKDVYFTQDIYCPKCKSKVKSINSNITTGLQEYNDLTFGNFERLNQTDKENLILELIGKWNS